MFKLSTVETLLSVLEDQVITPQQRLGVDKASWRDHTHTLTTHTNAHMHKTVCVLENWQSPSDNFRNKGEISGEWSSPHPAVPNSAQTDRHSVQWKCSFGVGITINKHNAINYRRQYLISIFSYVMKMPFPSFNAFP